jgi:transglutaminase-like putative cysteine protease
MSLDAPTSEEATRYRIRHATSYRYAADILLAHHLLHLKPRELERQHCLSHRLTIEPTPAIVADHLDYFGNPATYLALEAPHRGLVVRTEMEIEVAPPAFPDLAETPPWEEIAQRIGTAADGGALAANRLAYGSRLVPLLAELAAYAQPSFAPGRPIGAAALDLIERIHDEFTFDPVATTITTPLKEVLARRRGVCQDFAQLAIGCVRALGLAARYVSGYLRTLPPPGMKRLVGVDASHAWLSLWCGDDLWLDLDPTNGRVGSTDFVTLAWGRDYDDVSPVRGVLVGGGGQQLLVQVDVEPLDAPEPTTPARSQAQQ